MSVLPLPGSGGEGAEAPPSPATPVPRRHPAPKPAVAKQVGWIACYLCGSHPCLEFRRSGLCYVLVETALAKARPLSLPKTNGVVLAFRAPLALEGFVKEQWVAGRRLRRPLRGRQERGELPVVERLNKDLPIRRSACLEGGVVVARKSCGEGDATSSGCSCTCK